MQELKSKNLILDKILEISPWFGWNDRSLRVACKNLGLDENYYYIIFPKGVDDVLLYKNQLVNEAMTDRLALTDLTKLKIRDRVYLAIKALIEQNTKDKLAIKRMVSYCLVRGKTILGLKMIYSTVNKIWYNIGDKSTDFNFYTKRATLALIYISTLTYWVNDNSKNNLKTFEYLHKQIDFSLKYNPIKIFRKLFDTSNIPFIRLISK